MHLGTSWGDLGFILEPLVGILEALVGILEALVGILETALEASPF